MIFTMAKIINKEWQKKIIGLVNNNQVVDETIAFAPALKWLVLFLSSRDRPYAIHDIGAGVKRITTDTGICPCCKKPL